MWIKRKLGRRSERGAALAIALMLLVLAVLIFSYIFNIGVRKYEAERYGFSKDMLLQLEKEVTLTTIAALRDSTYWNSSSIRPYLLLDDTSGNISNLANNLCNNFFSDRAFSVSLVGSSNTDQIKWSCSNSLYAYDSISNVGRFTFTFTPDNTTNFNYLVEVSLSVTYTSGWITSPGYLPPELRPVFNYLGGSVPPMRILVQALATAKLNNQSSSSTTNASNLVSKRTFWVFSINRGLLIRNPYLALAPHLYDPFGLDLNALYEMGYSTDRSTAFPPGNVYIEGAVGINSLNNVRALFNDSIGNYGLVSGGVNNNLLDNFAQGHIAMWVEDTSDPVRNPIASEFYGDPMKLDPSFNSVDPSDQNFVNELSCSDQTSCSPISSRLFISSMGQWKPKTPDLFSNDANVFDRVDGNGRYSFTSTIVNKSQSQITDPTTIFVTVNAGTDTGVVNLQTKQVVTQFNANSSELSLEPASITDSGQWIEIPWPDLDGDGKLDAPYLAKVTQATMGQSVNPSPEDALNDEWLRMNSHIPGVANFIVTTSYDPNQNVTTIRMTAVGKYSGKKITSFSCSNVNLPTISDNGSNIRSVECHEVEPGTVEVTVLQNQNVAPDKTPRRLAVAVKGGNVIYTAPSDNTNTPPNLPITIVAAPSDDLTTRDVPGGDAVDMIRARNYTYQNGQLYLDTNNDGQGDVPVTEINEFFVKDIYIPQENTDIRNLDLDKDGNSDISFDETGMWSIGKLDVFTSGGTLSSRDIKYVLPNPNETSDTAHQRFRAILSLEGNIIVVNSSDEAVLKMLQDGPTEDLNRDAVIGLGVPITNSDLDSLYDEINNMKNELQVDEVTAPIIANNDLFRRLLDKETTYTDNGADKAYKSAPVNLVATNYVFLMPVDYDMDKGGTVDLASDQDRFFWFKGIMVSLNHSVQLLDKDAYKYFLASGDKVLDPNYWYGRLLDRIVTKSASDSVRNFFVVYGGIYTVFADVEGVYDPVANRILGFDGQIFIPLPQSVIDNFIGGSPSATDRDAYNILNLKKLWEPIYTEKNGKRLMPIYLEAFFEE